MKIQPDETVRWFQARWIGTGTFAWFYAARFVTWALLACSYAACVLTLYVGYVVTGLHLFFNPFTVIWAGVVAYAFTRFTMRYVNHDRPLRSLFGPLITELFRARHKVADGEYARTPCTHRIRIGGRTT